MKVGIQAFLVDLIVIFSVTLRLGGDLAFFWHPPRARIIHEDERSNTVREADDLKIAQQFIAGSAATPAS